MKHRPTDLQYFTDNDLLLRVEPIDAQLGAAMEEVPWIENEKVI